jgi:hypothetical protein
MNSDSLRLALEAQLAGGAYRGLARAWAFASLLPAFVLWLLAGWDCGLLGYFVALAWGLAAALSLSFAALGRSAGRRTRQLEMGPALYRAPASPWARLETGLLGISVVAGAVLAWAAVLPGSVPVRLLVTAGHAWAATVTVVAARLALAAEPLRPGRTARALRKP